MQKTDIPRKGRGDVPPTMFLRPRNPRDHREFEALLPRLEPVLIYADENGRDWVRWEMAREVAAQMGWGDMKCECCETSAAVGTELAVHLDTAWDEISWFFNE